MSWLVLAALPVSANYAASVAQDGESADRTNTSDDHYHATIHRGPYGVAHIEAQDFGSLGFGEGFAAAEDHLCNIAYELLVARGEKARYLGPGPEQANLMSDVVVRGLGIDAQAKSGFAAQTAENQRWIDGYVAGYNRYLRDEFSADTGAWCTGALWVDTATVHNFMERMVLIAQTLPRMSAALASTRPPEQQTAERGPASRADVSQSSMVPGATTEHASLSGFIAATQAQLQESIAAASLSGFGSNGWAIGRERSENERGLLLANPHYPWYGGNRFWEKHLTIPGRLNVYGVSLLGIPGVAIGFNEAIGWTHTVSASQRVVLYRLTLNPENNRQYRFEDGWRDLQEREVEVEVLAEDGTLDTQRHSLFFSHHGPLLTLPNMAWDERFAYAARDANNGNAEVFAQWRAMGEADDMEQLIAAHRRYNALPWVNTMATSADGRAVYLDNSTVGYLSKAAEISWQGSLSKDPLAAGLYQQRGMVLLDGSRQQNEWLDDPSAPLRGTVPFERRPMLERSDYIFNSNDSYWLTNPASPLEGFSVLYGETRTARSLRTRMNARLLENRYGDAGTDGRFSRKEIQEALFANRGLGAELLLPGLIKACTASTQIEPQACEVLAAYDGTLNLDSAGAVLFREWITRFDMDDTREAGALFATSFDPAKPVETPKDPAEAEAAIAELATAVKVMRSAGLPLSATLRDTQFAWRAGESIAIHGGNSFEGVANLQLAGNPVASPISGVKPEDVEDSRYLTSDGYPIVHGSSFIMTLGFNAEGPEAEAMLSYSQSGVPGAAHFRDQTQLYAQKEWRSIAYHAADVREQAVSSRTITGPRE
ncbi:MAG: acylase [Pseudomonadota bacterium]